MSAPRENPQHWTTTDGYRYVSVPVKISDRWTQCQDSRGRLCYVNGPYTIVREVYGAKPSYAVLRDREKLGFLYSRFKDAKAHVEKNAAGLEVVNVA